MLSQLKKERLRDQHLQLKLRCGESVRPKLGIIVGGVSQFGTEEYGNGLA